MHLNTVRHKCAVCCTLATSLTVFGLYCFSLLFGAQFGPVRLAGNKKRKVMHEESKKNLPRSEALLAVDPVYDEFKLNSPRLRFSSFEAHTDRTELTSKSAMRFYYAEKTREIKFVNVYLDLVALLLLLIRPLQIRARPSVHQSLAGALVSALLCASGMIMAPASISRARAQTA